MMIRVKVFAAAKDIVGNNHIDLELDEGATIADLQIQLLKLIPDLESHLPRSAFAVNQQYAQPTDVVPIDCEVAMIPPVSGG